MAFDLNTRRHAKDTAADNLAVRVNATVAALPGYNHGRKTEIFQEIAREELEGARRQFEQPFLDLLSQKFGHMPSLVSLVEVESDC
jgi:hypothetical protein